ncbi:BnaC05g51230D [Brassica napus]|uniref:BnaC05g51230D protein n=1 Tax=Brassica napus TaxID=3708 RepID=A0A078JA73_BRANA|nr:BnaC05g51230D [Brassica napus]
MATQISKKRKFVADGVFFAELNGVVLPLASIVFNAYCEILFIN